ncbi:MAG TPA: hypothetical protein VGP07_11550 [Polyangia bacterium]|jgi:hypothetical protein
MTKRVLRRTVGLVALTALGACASTQGLTQGEVGRSGARQFAAAKEKVFPTVLGALAAEGYEIASTDVAAGVIVTRPMAVHNASAVTARAYRVTVAPEGVGVRVVAQPILYAGQRDVSGAELWTLNGPDGERAQWNDLFGIVDATLEAGPIVAPEGQPIVASDIGAAAPLAKVAPTRASDNTAPVGGLRPAGLTAPPATNP